MAQAVAPAAPAAAAAAAKVSLPPRTMRATQRAWTSGCHSPPCPRLSCSVRRLLCTVARCRAAVMATTRTQAVAVAGAAQAAHRRTVGRQLQQNKVHQQQQQQQQQQPRRRGRQPLFTGEAQVRQPFREGDGDDTKVARGRGQSPPDRPLGSDQQPARQQQQAGASGDKAARLAAWRTACAIARFHPSRIEDDQWQLVRVVRYEPSAFADAVALCDKRPSLLQRFSTLQLGNLLCGLAAAGQTPGPKFTSSVAHLATARIAQWHQDHHKTRDDQIQQQQQQPQPMGWDALTFLALGCARLQAGREHADLFRAIAAAATDVLQQSARTAHKKRHGTWLAMLLWAFARSGLYDTPLFTSAAALINTEPHVLYLMDANDLLAVMQSFHALGHKDAVLRYRLTQRLLTQVGRLNNEDLSQALLVLAQVGNTDEELLDRMYLLLRRRLKLFKPPALANTIVGLAGLKCRDKELLDAVSWWCQNKLQNFDGKQLASCIYAFASLRYYHVRLYTKAGHRVVNLGKAVWEQFKPQQLVDLLEGMAAVKHKHSALLFSSAVWVKSHLSVCTLNQVMSMKASFAGLEHEDDELYNMLDSVINRS